MAAGTRQTKRGNRIKASLAAGAVCLAAVSGAVWGFYRQEENLPPQESALSAVTETVPAETAAPEGTPVPPTAGLPAETAPEETLPPAETAAPEERVPPAETEPPAGAGTSAASDALVVEGYDYSQPVPASDPAPEDYFDDAAFIGDSRTDGLLLYSGIKGAVGLSYKGLMVSELEDKTVKFTVSGITDTVMGALSKESYGKVYLMLGVNELGWYNDQKFYDTYTQEVQRIQELQPGAAIYLQSILPVTQSESDSHPYFTNEKIGVYNALIAQVAEEQQVFYLDVAAAVKNEAGVLPEEASTDGIHLKKDYYKLWYEYLQNHIVTVSAEE